MIKEIGYNGQRNNFSFAGKLSGFIQCFATSAWMFMSYFAPSSIIATDDKALAVYVDDVEATVGKPGIAEKIMQKYRWIRGKTSQWWLIQQEGIDKWLWHYGVKGIAVFRDRDCPFGDLPELIEKYGPVIVGTNKMGGLPGGHIILAVGAEGDDIICHDPFGDATVSYTIHNGAYVRYPQSFLRHYAGSMIRCIYWDGVA